MSRILFEVNSSYVPSPYITDKTQQKLFFGNPDPKAVASLGVGDRWYPLNAATPPPPPPPTTYVPRVVPAYGTYMPDDTTTGIVTAKSTHQTITLTGPITTPGTTFTSKEIIGDIIIQAANVTIEDCILRGPKTWPSGDGAVINCLSDACSNALIRDCTYAPLLPNYYRDFIRGHGFLAERNRGFWANDTVGIYSFSSKSYNTNAQVKGCYFTDPVYWRGNSAAYPGQPQGNITVTTTWGTTFSVPPEPVHANGTHNDGIQIQGGKGPAKSVWCIGNRIETYDAYARVHWLNQGHPLGWDDPIPQLGSGDSPNLFVYKTAGPRNPMMDGQFANNGQSFVIQQNTGLAQFNQIDSCVVEYNWCNDGGQGVNIQANGGGYTTIQCTLRNNKFGENWYTYNPTGNKQIYVIRVDSRAGATISGLSTNTWYEGGWQPIGSALTEGRTSGIWYDG